MTNEPTEIEVYREPQQTSAVVLWGTNEPRGMTARMAEVADAIKDVLISRGLTQRIGDNDYVKVEGWSMVGSMLGVFPRTLSVELTEEGIIEAETIEKVGRNGRPYQKHYPRIEGALTYRAAVELVGRDGLVAGGSVSFCTKHEEQWRDRDDNQVASMAQTRATAKAFRQSFGFVMPMAGYSATPAEEMGAEVDWWTLLGEKIKAAKWSRDFVADGLGCAIPKIKATARDWLREHGTGDVDADLAALMGYIGDGPDAGTPAEPSRVVEAEVVEPEPAKPAPARDPREPAKPSGDWWLMLMSAAREANVKNSQISTLVTGPDGLDLKASARRWLNEHTSGEDDAADIAHLLANAAGL